MRDVPGGRAQPRRATCCHHEKSISLLFTMRGTLRLHTCSHDAKKQSSFLDTKKFLFGYCLSDFDIDRDAGFCEKETVPGPI